MAPSSQTAHATLNASIFTVLPVFRFMRPACEVHAGEELLASMSGSTLRRVGEIEVGDCCYRIDGSNMIHTEGTTVATYVVVERFMRFTRVKLTDPVTLREFDLRQRQMWCGSLILSEAGKPIAEFAQRWFQSKYRITAQESTPQSVLLLAIWLAAVAGVFNA